MRKEFSKDNNYCHIFASKGVPFSDVVLLQTDCVKCHVVTRASFRCKLYLMVLWAHTRLFWMYGSVTPLARGREQFVPATASHGQTYSYLQAKDHIFSIYLSIILCTDPVTPALYSDYVWCQKWCYFYERIKHFFRVLTFAKTECDNVLQPEQQSG